jgi:glutathione S-transferase
MKEFAVYTIPGSPFGRAVLATLEEKGARYRLKAMTPQQMRSPEHLALHPFGRMPSLEHGDAISIASCPGLRTRRPMRSRRHAWTSS